MTGMHKGPIKEGLLHSPRKGGHVLSIRHCRLAALWLAMLCVESRAHRGRKLLAHRAREAAD